MFLTLLKTKPTSALLDLVETKNYLRVDDSADDDLITLMSLAATRKVESLIDKKLLTQTWELFLDRIPMSQKPKWWDGTQEMAMSELISGQRALNMPFGPLQSVTSIITYDNSDVATTFSASSYSVDTAGPIGRIALRLGESWPTTVLRPINGIKITAVFGYGSTSVAVPEDIILATKILVAHMYEHRGDDSESKIPNQVHMLLEPFKMPKVGC